MLQEPLYNVTWRHIAINGRCQLRSARIVLHAGGTGSDIINRSVKKMYINYPQFLWITSGDVCIDWQSA